MKWSEMTLVDKICFIRRAEASVLEELFEDKRRCSIAFQNIILEELMYRERMLEDFDEDELDEDDFEVNYDPDDEDNLPGTFED